MHPALLPLRILQALLAIILLALSAYFISWWYSPSVHSAGAPSRISFLLFTSIWTLLALVYLVLAERLIAIPAKLAHKWAVVAVEALTTLFWFAGWVAVAAWLGDGYWAGVPRRTGIACAVFGAFEWLAFVATLALTCLSAFRGGRGASGKPAAAGGPGQPYV